MKKIALLLALSTSLFSIGLYGAHFESYIDSSLDNISTLLTDVTLNENCVLTLKYGNYVFNEDGLQNILIEGIKLPAPNIYSLVEMAHDKNVKIKLGLGGKRYPLAPYLKNSEDAYYLASAIAQIVDHYKFDGVDFALFDATYNVDLAIAFFHELRGFMENSKIITITVPGQGWAAPFAPLINAVTKDVDLFNIMESNIWLENGSTYIQQIESDIECYLRHWQVTKEQLQLGLKAGLNEMTPGNFLSELDAEHLAQFAASMGLYGVMLADLHVANKPSPYAQVILSTLFPPPPPSIDEPSDEEESLSHQTEDSDDFE